MANAVFVAELSASMQWLLGCGKIARSLGNSVASDRFHLSALRSDSVNRMRSLDVLVATVQQRGRDVYVELQSVEDFNAARSTQLSRWIGQVTSIKALFTQVSSSSQVNTVASPTLCARQCNISFHSVPSSRRVS